jgi:hypothetical protein
MSIRRALKTIAQLTCGISPRAIHVKALGGSGDCAYAASIPWEYRVEIQTYLAHHLSIAVERDTPRSYFRTGGCADRARYDALALATNAASSNDHWY